MHTGGSEITVHKTSEIARLLMQTSQLFSNDQALANGAVFALDFRKHSTRTFPTSSITPTDTNNTNSISLFKDPNGTYIKVLSVHPLPFLEVDGSIGVEITVLEKSDVRSTHWVLAVCINNINLRGKMIDQRANGFNIVINPESATL